MTPSTRLAGPLAALLPLVLGAGCAELEHDPWAEIGKGSNQLGVSTGWAFYEATVSARGTSGVLAPGGNSAVGEDTVDLDPNFGAALKYSRFLSDHFSLGGIVEYRSFEPADSVSPLTAELTAEDFNTWHFILSSRYWFNPLKKQPRLKPFVGLDLSWIPSVDLGDVQVDYPSGSGIPSEQITVEGSDYWTIAPVVGVSTLLTDNITLDCGAFYEWALTESEESLTFDNLGGATADVKVEPQGLIVFIGLSFFF